MVKAKANAGLKQHPDLWEITKTLKRTVFTPMLVTEEFFDWLSFLFCAQMQMNIKLQVATISIQNAPRVDTFY
jgi:hypothetical protein